MQRIDRTKRAGDQGIVQARLAWLVGAGLLCLLLTFIHPLFGILFLVFGPLLLYVWWPVKALREEHVEYLLYSHIQLLLELAAISGLARAELSLRS